MRHRLVSLALILIDTAIVSVVPCLAIMARFDGTVEANCLQIVQKYLPAMIIIQLGSFYAFGLYHRLWRYAGIDELRAIVVAVSVGSGVVTAYMLATAAGLPRSIYILGCFFTMVLVGASRILIRILYHRRQRTNGQRARVLIVGAGDAGAMLARELNQRYFDSKELIGFVDDDLYKHDKMLFGAKVLGGCGDIAAIAGRYRPDEIIVAMPSIGGQQHAEIIRACQQTGCQVKTVPGLYELIDGKVTVQQLRNVELEDLLRRDPVQLDIAQIAGYLAGKRILVTGAGGSIGAELCRQIAAMAPKTLHLLGKGENSIYEIHCELQAGYPKLSLTPEIADIRDKERIDAIFAQARPQVVFHAAAHKHVPLMERQPKEAVSNNIFGTQIVAEAADRHRTEIFIMISTDKAVNPTSVMGATKRVAEMVIQNLNSVSTTKFAAVRFGNVLGSRGSVVPLFRKQIAAGGPITVTHPDMKRYFMTIPEAVQLVLQAGALAKGGEVFVLDMGEPVKIVDLACDLIRLSGLEPYKDIAIEFTGPRPGEKLYEELLTAEEGTSATRHAHIHEANLRTMNEMKLRQGLLSLKQETDPEEITNELIGLVPNYQRPGRKKSKGRELILEGQSGDDTEHVKAVPAGTY